MASVAKAARQRVPAEDNKQPSLLLLDDDVALTMFAFLDAASLCRLQMTASQYSTLPEEAARRACAATAAAANLLPICPLATLDRRVHQKARASEGRSVE